MLEDQLAAQLSQLGLVRSQIEPTLELFRQRLGTEQTNAQNSLNTSLADRGVWDSSIRGTETERLETGFGRERQDVALQAAGQYADLDQQAAEAYGEFARQYQEMLLNLGADFAENPTPAMGAGGLGGAGAGGGNQSGRRGNGQRPRRQQPRRQRARGRR